MNIAEIREHRAAKVAEARSLLTAAESEKRELNPTESARFDALKGEIAALEAQESRAAFLDEAERRSQGQPVDKPHAQLEQRVSLLEVVQASIEHRALTGAALEYHQEQERRTGQKAQGVFVPLSALEKRAPNTTATAGQLVGTDHRGDQYIGPLRDSLVVRSLGIRSLTGLRGNVEIPKHGDSTAAGWVNENEALPTSGMTFANVAMRPRHVGAISSWSRQLAQQSDPSIEQLLRDDLSYAVGAAVDRAILSGDGVKEPLGVLNTTGVQTIGVPSTWNSVLDVEGLLQDLNVTPNAWYTSPSVLRDLRGTLKASTAGSEYIATASRIGEIAAFTSNAAPAGKAILADWSQLILGTWGSADLLVNPYETDAYSKGNVLIRLITTHDLCVRHPQAFVVCA